MEEVKRYTIDFSDGETAEGVLYDDYAALKARVGELGKNNVALKSRAEELQKTCLIYRQSVGDLEKERDSLRAQLEAAKSQIEAWAFRCKEFEAQLEAAKAKLTAQPDGVAVPKSLDIVLSTMRLALNLAEAEGEKPVQMDFKSAETLYVAARLLQKTAAPAREDGVRERRLELALAEIEGRSNVTTGGHSTLAQRLERIHALAAQALSAPAPAPVCICTYAHPEAFDGPQRDCPIHGEKAPAPACKTCGGKGRIWYPRTGHPETTKPCPDCAKES